MKNRLLAIAGIITLLLIGSAIGGAIVAARRAEATRNSAGTVSLATSPVVSNQTIGSALWNNTFGGLRQDVEDSLDRNGRGGMLAALRGIDGTVGSPAFSFTSETGTGYFRNGAGDLRLSILGSAKGFWSATGLGIGVAPLWPLHVIKTAVSGATALAGTTVLLESNGTHYLSIVAPNANQEGILFGDVASGSRGYIIYTNSGAGSPDQLQFATTNGTIRAFASSAGFTIGASGTAINARYRGTTSWTPGAVGAGGSTNTTISLTGAASGADCFVTVPAGFNNYINPSCAVTANTCTIYLSNVDGASHTPTSGNYSCVVENP